MSIFSEILSQDEGSLSTLSNRGTVNRAARELPGAGITLTALEDGIRAVFSDGTELVAEGSLQNYRCSCPSRIACKHLVMAVLAAKDWDGLPRPEGGGQPAEEEREKAEEPVVDIPEPEVKELRYSARPARYIRERIASLIAGGLTRIPDNIPDHFRQLAVICHGNRLAQAERLCTRIAGKLDLAKERSASFDTDSLLLDITQLEGICERLEEDRADGKDVGTFRDSYSKLPGLDIHGLGSSAWHSAGGMNGVTTYFYCEQMKRVVRYVQSSTQMMGLSSRDLFRSPAPWGLPGAVSNMARGACRLLDPRMSPSGALSSSDSTRAVVLGASKLSGDLVKPIRHRDFGDLLEAVREATDRELREGERAGDALVFLLQDAVLSDMAFDEANQAFTAKLRDGQGRAVTLTARYSEYADLLVRNLMAISAIFKDKPLSFLARLFLEDGQLKAFPYVWFDRYLPVSLSLEPVSANQQPVNPADFPAAGEREEGDASAEIARMRGLLSDAHGEAAALLESGLDNAGRRRAALERLVSRMEECSLAKGSQLLREILTGSGGQEENAGKYLRFANYIRLCGIRLDYLQVRDDWKEITAGTIG